MTTAPSEALKLYGTEQEAPAARTLSAGALTASLDAGKLRWIRYGGTEALRGLAFVVRGSGWETYAPQIANLEIEEGEGGFRVGYDARIESPDGVLAYRADIVADDERRLVFTVEFEPETAFRTSRTGFVALHPVEGVAGEPCAITHGDGTVEETRFPGLIMPLQPFFDISAMRHRVAPGVWLTCRFEGADPWETEDQRNWTDASYKTYYRPLALPYPYPLAAGERLRQVATLTFEGSAQPAAAGAGEDDAIAIAVGGGTGTQMPEIGLGVANLERAHLGHGLDLLEALGPGHLVCECDPRDEHAAEALAAGRGLAEALGAGVVLEITVPCERPVLDELAAVAEIAAQAGLKPDAIVPEQARLLKFTLEKIPALGIPDFDEVYAAARAAFPGVRLGGGVFTNFTELNRNVAEPALFDFLTHATCAVVHEPDDRSVMETLQTLPDIVASAKAWAGGKPYRIAPSAIGMRFNPYGPDVHRNADNGRYSFNRQDPRHRALLGAAFTLGYAARVAPLGIEALAFGQPSGALGMVYRRTGDPQPWFDDLAGPAVPPLYHIVSALAAAKGAAVRAVTSGDATRVLGLAYESGGGTLLWLANLTPETQAVTVSGLSGSGATVGRLDSSNFVDAASDPAGFAASRGEPGDPSRLALAPFAVARIETGG
ncbi:MAG: hypothetical protein OXO52_04610 [Rhodospirillales bacterium]|nr:hypothetical protein [Rhodospirillales bacterium]MDE0381515.1 hypothetical protein [Rhodospirillales bacterium]